MSTRVTDSDNVALYDSVTGKAFGPVFECAEFAESFLAMTEALGTPDLRTLSSSTLDDLYIL